MSERIYCQTGELKVGDKVTHFDRFLRDHLGYPDPSRPSFVGTVVGLDEEWLPLASVDVGDTFVHRYPCRDLIHWPDPRRKNA